MTLRLRVDPGGEKYIPFAKKKLVELKAWMKQSGLTTFTKRYFINDTEQILINSLLLSYGQSLDTIRILFSAGYIDYVPMAMPNPVPYRGVNVEVASVGGVKSTYVMASDGEVLASEVLIDDVVGGPRPWDPANSDDFSRYLPIPINGSATVMPWHGGGEIWMGVYDHDYEQFYARDHTLSFSCPEDCIYPTPNVSAPVGQWIFGDPAGWADYWQAGVTAFNARRKAWFQKNSDEFIAALKTGFAPGAEGVTRAELQLGAIPEEWRLYIRLSVGNRYSSYPPDGLAGQRTHRGLLFTEKSFLETVESDTSADLSQAGVKVTKREVVLTYQVVGEDDPRETTVTGYLTQTITEHTPYALTRNDVYDNWYYSYVNDGAWPNFTNKYSGKDAPFFENGNYNKPIGVVVNGVEQSGYGADSSAPFTIGGIGNPIEFIGVTPPFPKYSNTITATAVVDYIPTWHKDSKIIYDSAGVGASTDQNDSAMHGVTEVHISPVGATLVGTDEPFGIFIDGSVAQYNDLKREVYGTAVYNFNWQTGALTFSKWKSLTDDNGNEVASKIIDLPALLSVETEEGDIRMNCLITYKGLHWPDVVAALKVRDATLSTDDPGLYTLIQAVKAG